MWPFKRSPPKEQTAARRLLRRTADTKEGREIVARALYIAEKHPELTEAQCIRAAYWGTPGEP